VSKVTSTSAFLDQYFYSSGLAVVFAEDAVSVADENRPGKLTSLFYSLGLDICSAAWDDLCPIYDASGED
jgi:hypothetical protein